MTKIPFQTLKSVFFLFLGIFVIFEMVWAVSYLSQPVTIRFERAAVPEELPKIKPPTASLSLSPSSGSYKVGESFEVEAILDTGGEPTSGADVILLFDPTMLAVISVNPGTLYSDYPVSRVDSRKGRIELSGTTGPVQHYSGKGVLATIKLKAKREGEAELAFDFELGGTRDCNIVFYQTANDMLERVDNARFSIVK